MPCSRRSGKKWVTSDLHTTFGHRLYKKSTRSVAPLSLPLEGKADDTRKTCDQETFGHRPASSSRAQPRDLSCTAAICTHAPSLKRRLGASLYRLSLTHVLPVCQKDPSTSTLMTRKKDGIVSHPFSYRCVELCLSEALYPAPSARPFSKGLLVSLL